MGGLTIFSVGHILLTQAYLPNQQNQHNMSFTSRMVNTKE